MSDKVNWRNHFIELLVVIIGISIAFSLNSWKESRKQDELEKKYMTSLKSDLEFDLAELNQIADTSGYYLKMQGGLLGVLGQQNYQDDSLFYFVVALYGFQEFVPRDNTYESMKGSGKLEIISDFDLKNELTIQYNQYYKQLKALDEYHKKTVYDEISPYLNKNVQFSGRPVILNNEFLKDRYFINKSYASYYLLKGKITSYRDVAEKTKALISKLDLELKK